MVKSERYADHPRYGREPIETGLNPQPFVDGVYLGTDATTYDEVIDNYELVTGQKCPLRGFAGHEKIARRLPNTAIEANAESQPRATIPVTHYFDLESKCRDCSRSFIFFAQEQKYWYEELGFPPDVSCVRCVQCRKKRQSIAQAQKTYESLFHEAHRTEEQSIEMANACLFLIEQGVFPKEKTQTIRMLLNRVVKNMKARHGGQVEQIRERLRAI